MIELRFNVQGLEEAQRQLGAVREKLRDELAAELYRQAEDVMGESKESYVPVDLGALKNSGHVELPAIDGDRVSVKLGFGGAAAPYALAVHEHLSPSSPPSWQKAESAGRPVKFSPSGHGPKYLERPLLAAAQRITRALADAVKRAVT